MNELVSAIITTHNRKELCKYAIDSVLNQTYSNIECIVIDDASSDRTEEYLGDLINSGAIQYIYIDKKNSKGGNYARNQGIKYANGKYVAFLDDDDEWFPSKIEKQVHLLEDNKDTGFVYCGLVRELNMDKEMRRPDDIIDEEKFREGDLSKHILTKIITTTSTIMIRKKLLEQCGGFDEELKFWQEHELNIRVLQETKAACVRENLVLYRIIKNDKNRLTNKIKGWEDAVAYICNKHQAIISKLTDEENAYRKMYIYLDGINRARNVKSPKYFLKYIIKILVDKKVRKIFAKKCINKIKGSKRK